MPKNERALKQKAKALISSEAEKLKKQVSHILALFSLNCLS